MKRFSLKTALSYIIPCALFTAAIVWLAVSLGNASENAERRELEAVKTTVENGITMCYAVEGAYPPSAEYLRENYGITYDAAKYIVHYEIFADNIRPTVNVIERGA